MIIFKQGIIPEYNFTCHVCGCEFAAYRTECEITEVVKWPETKIREVAYVDCPYCHTKLNTDISEVNQND